MAQDSPKAKGSRKRPAASKKRIESTVTATVNGSIDETDDNQKGRQLVKKPPTKSGRKLRGIPTETATVSYSFVLATHAIVSPEHLWRTLHILP